MQKSSVHQKVERQTHEKMEDDKLKVILMFTGNDKDIMSIGKLHEIAPMMKKASLQSAWKTDGNIPRNEDI